MTRQEAIKWLSNLKMDIGKPQHQELWHYEQAIDEIIEALEQEPKSGRWKQAEDIEKEYAVCTNCKHHGEFYMDYCPNCGARMESEER